MIDIRLNRLHEKRKKTKPLVLVFKAFAIGYMTFGTLYYLAGDTNASFSDTETVSTGFMANMNEEEMDKPVDTSSLKITADQEAVKNLTFIFKNMSEDILTNMDYQLYFSEGYSPKNGVKLVTGSIKKLKKAEEVNLVLGPKKGAGKYILKVTLSKNIIIWSEEIVISNTVEKEKEKVNDSAPDKTNENNEDATPSDTNPLKNQDVNPEPDKKEVDDEANQQEAEENSEQIEEGNTAQSDGAVSEETVDDKVSDTEKESKNNK